ncbi:hypothetical protein [Bacillus infantis]|uniref:Uncharacterized protein n=1 Tax=Bacillus infantis TaxID=324767 RepID=A0A5D4RGT9_9BACI|nr:hypothetical protein [Bacillus infantis]TYS48652.1 hypothetical protein FZD51_11105 [Bacillus infantis]
MTEAVKGSQHQFQTYVNKYSEALNQDIFSHSPSLLAYIHGERKINWKSPLAHENYKEYQDDFLQLYYDDEDECKKSKRFIRDHWAKNGPVWDGIGLVEGITRKGLIMVEAKSHLRETHSKIKATSLQSISQITETIASTQELFGSTTPITPWLKEYYQLANRFAYLYLLNQELHIPTWLILVQFIDDDTHIKTSKDQWLTHYQEVFHTLGIKHYPPLLSQVVVLYLPAIPRYD